MRNASSCRSAFLSCINGPNVYMLLDFTFAFSIILVFHLYSYCACQGAHGKLHIQNNVASCYGCSHQ